jgi:hypothetical protein
MVAEHGLRQVLHDLMVLLQVVRPSTATIGYLDALHPRGDHLLKLLKDQRGVRSGFG